MSNFLGLNSVGKLSGDVNSQRHYSFLNLLSSFTFSLDPYLRQTTYLGKFLGAF